MTSILKIAVAKSYHHAKFQSNTGSWSNSSWHNNGLIKQQNAAL